MARILVVDDEANIRMTVQMALEQKKYTVELAGDVAEALEKFGNGDKWDLVLLDQRMPGQTGMEALRAMKERKPDQRIVMISAYGVYELVHEAMEAGAVDFLRKPFTVDTLRNVVKSALERPRSAGETLLPSPSGVIFQTPVVDGYRIESRLGEGLRSGNSTLYEFIVRSPEGNAQACTVSLPDYVTELVKAHLDRESLPGDDRFWQAFCEEAVAQHLWRQGEIPADGRICIEELTTDMKRWVSNTLKGLAEHQNAKGR